MEDHTTVACLGSMKWLGAFMCIEPVHRSLVGAATTEDGGSPRLEAHRVGHESLRHAQRFNIECLNLEVQLLAEPLRTNDITGRQRGDE